jgi:hypothetical protein
MTVVDVDVGPVHGQLHGFSVAAGQVSGRHHIPVIRPVIRPRATLAASLEEMAR